MFHKKSCVVSTSIIIGCLSFHLFAQAKSAVQFWDTTGNSKAGKIGWTGDVSTGHIFIQTPQDGEILKTKAGGIDVAGTINAVKFTGDGSLLTNLPAATTSAANIAGLSDSLKKKADTSLVTAKISGKADSAWVSGKLGAKADTTWTNTKMSTKVDSANVNMLLGTKADTTWVKSKVSGMGSGTITAVTADSGIAGGGTSGAVILKVKYGGSGTAQTVSRSDHTHTGFTDANISSVSATKITGLPDSLKKKADTGWVNSNFYTQSQSNSLIGGAHSSGWINLSASGFVLNGVTLYGTLISTSSSSIGNITVTAPTSGFVLVWANTAIQPGDNNYTDVSIAISNTPNAATITGTSCFATFQWEANNLEVSNSISTCNMFTVQAGSNTFYLNASSATGNPVVKGLNLMALFVKTQL